MQARETKPLSAAQDVEAVIATVRGSVETFAGVDFDCGDVSVLADIQRSGDNGVETC